MAHLSLLLLAFALVGVLAPPPLSASHSELAPRWYHPKMPPPVSRDRLMLRGDGAKSFGDLPTTRPFKYSGGYVIAGNPNITIHIVYYGAWKVDERTIINNFIRSLGGYKGNASEATVAKWWDITTQYYLKRGGMTKPKYITSKVRLGEVILDNYSLGRGPFAWQAMFKIAQQHVNSKKLPVDRNALYLVLTSADVMVSGFCSNWCGFHDIFYSKSGAELYYAYAGHHGQCMGDCGSGNVMANGYPGAESTVSTIAHEVTEAVTDPDGEGWVTDDEYENADLCEWQGWGYYATAKDKRGRTYKYNMVGNHQMRFLVQLNYDLSKKKCARQKS